MVELRKHSLLLLGVGLGMVGGFLYWKFVGCVSGTCPITSNPVASTLYGAMMGGLLVSMFKKEIKNEKD